MKMFAALLWSLLLVAVPAAAADTLPATVFLDLGTLDTGRPAKVTLWFLQGNCGAEPLCLAPAVAKEKVVVLSHGTMGSAEDYAWLGKSLAAAGFLVVGVNHFGESRLYGTETQDPRVIPQIWQRAQDLSAILDGLAARPALQQAVDWTHVVMLGHSAGGQTAAMLAGARFDLHRMIAWCDTAAAAPDRSCSYGRGLVSAPPVLFERFAEPQADARIRKLVLLDPALGAALQPESLRGVALPALIIGATQTDFLPWVAHGARYAEAIPGARTILLDKGEGHFIFLSPCTHPAQALGLALCTDRPGVDRAAVQQALAPQIIDFVRAAE
jgi:predicted dienelactone hydrolase